MEMCYDGALVMPKNYAVVNEEEMTYVEGGARFTVYGTAKSIRTRLSTIIGASLVGQGATTALGALLGNAAGAVIGFIVGEGWFGSYRSNASSAHNQVEDIIEKYGKNKRCKMTTTCSFLMVCTGMSVKVA